MNLDQITNTLTQSADIPLLTAFVLGILVALNPCQLAINISALSYIMKHNDTGIYQPILYALGRCLTYTAIAWVFICLIGGGRNVPGINTVFNYTEQLLPYILFISAAFLLYRALSHHHHNGDNCHNSHILIRRNASLGSFFIGMILALAFCPESALFYFGILIPLSLNSQIGILLPLVFALSASIPVLIIAFIMQNTIRRARHFVHSFEHFQQALNIITAILFVILALWII